MYTSITMHLIFYTIRQMLSDQNTGTYTSMPNKVRMVQVQPTNGAICSLGPLEQDVNITTVGVPL